MLTVNFFAWVGSDNTDKTRKICPHRINLVLLLYVHNLCKYCYFCLCLKFCWCLIQLSFSVLLSLQMLAPMTIVDEYDDGTESPQLRLHRQFKQDFSSCDLDVWTYLDSVQ